MPGFNPTFGQFTGGYPTGAGYYPPSVNYPTMAAQPIQGLVKVTGLEGAKAYQMPPNSAMPLFDANSDIMYVKTTDGAGFPTIKQFAFCPVDVTDKTEIEYVQRPEFDKLVEEVKELANAKQPISAKQSAKQPAE